jgi:transcriptional regulator with PAS, ATPase and Fis domain
MRLKEIQPTIQQIVVAISSVLKIEVEIADEELFRIAGTGIVKSEIWKDMRNEDYIYRRCLETAKPIIVDKPGFHDYCVPCMHYKNCKELGEVCCPIMLEGRALGVIGLIAFDQEQRSRLFNEVEAKIEFLLKMADLIATKIKESELIEEQQIVERKLSAVVSHIDNGIVMINQSGQCEFINPSAAALLGLAAGQLPDRELLEQLTTPFGISESKEEQSQEPEGKLITVKVRERFNHMFATYYPAHDDGYMRDAVIMIADPAHMTDIALKYTEENHKGYETIIGNHPRIQAMKDMLRKVANNRSPILIRGESGTGKELIADNIHRYSERRGSKYFAVNCVVLPEPVLDSQLFGGGGKPGKLAQADGGTLFLDDISEMPMAIQLKLLRVLEEKSIWPQNEDEESSKPIDVRIIAATNKDLEQLMRKGLFRSELYYKLTVIPVDVPPLRERKQDILLLANHFLQIHSQTNRKYISTISEDVKKVIITYHWPGNIRELSNVIEYAVNFSNSTIIGTEHLPDYLRNIETAGFNSDTYNLRDIEKEVIERALSEIGGNGGSREEVAEQLGIGRATLFRKMQQYGLN